ncbi:kinesin-like protein KIN-13B [Rutidosis leptorrhynchoides]|uniref:kinesin-like protein KIN-13B n=1 Tax=Rutidosis leptorrhynchoides TaxID=125765 RepID=UPI003A98F7B4
MNAVGRQGQGQISGVSAAHHHRQHSDNLFDVTSSSSSSSNGTWLQFAGLQHLQQQPSSNTSSSEDFGYYAVVGGGGQVGRMYDNKNSRNFGASDLFTEPLTPPGRHEKHFGNGGDDRNGFSPGLLDIHSIDTELISEMPVTGTRGAPLYNDRGKIYDDVEAFFDNNKPAGKARGLSDNNVMTSFAWDKEKTGSVAKIKVVVDLTEYMEKHEFVFDAVLNEEVFNDEVYRETVEPIVPIIFKRTKATCFAYGQTGKIQPDNISLKLSRLY